MDPLIIAKVILGGTIAASEVPAALEGQPWNEIKCDTWKVAETNPTVRFRVAHTGDALLLHFHVSDSGARAVNDKDNGRVWEDSCCEFFVSPDGNDTYYNFECNCIGTLLLHFGKKGSERPNAPHEAYEAVQRWSSLGSDPFGHKDGPLEWDLTEIIPCKALYGHKIASFDGRKMKGNFYKCGDKTLSPHFLSWAPIDLPSPAFHCPEFFGEMVFE